MIEVKLWGLLGGSSISLTAAPQGSSQADSLEKNSLVVGEENNKERAGCEGGRSVGRVDRAHPSCVRPVNPSG
jgi:hypothetical protein